VHYSTISTSNKLPSVSCFLDIIEIHKLISLILNKDSQQNNQKFVRQKFSEDLN